MFKPMPNSAAWNSSESTKPQVVIDRLRSRSIHCSNLAQHALSAKIAAELEQLALDYEADARKIETLLSRKRRAAPRSHVRN